jgi:hypothetical protein
MKIATSRTRPHIWLGGLTLLILAFFCNPGVGQAISINRNNLLSDLDLNTGSAMTRQQVQRFLQSRGSGLADLKFSTPDGTRSAADIIFEAGKRNNISQKYLLVLLQKEQSLITSRTPSDYQLNWATGYAVCDSCSTEDPRVQKFKGFYKQVDWGARAFVNTETNQWGTPKGYLPSIAKIGKTISGWGPRIPKVTLDGITVTPANAATAALYSYTPWVGKYAGGDVRWGGSSVVAKLWDEWFRIHYPDGSLLRVRGEGGIWLIKDGKRHPFHSRSAFDSSYELDHVADVSLSELQAYPLGTAIKYPEFSLLQAPSGGIYLLADGKKRPIPSREVFNAIGFNSFEVIPVTDAELSLYPKGEKVSKPDSYPTGILLQSRESGGITYVENGVRHAIWSREILNNRFKYRTWKIVSQSEIERYKIGDPVKFKDGEIITSPKADGVYLISNGQRRPIPSPEVLRQLGLKWENLIRTSDKALKLHPLGDRVDYDAS